MAKKKKSTAEELEELDRVYTKMAGKGKKKGGAKASTVLICIASVLLVAAIGLGVWFLFSDNWLTMDQVSLGGVAMTGKSKKEAKTMLAQMAKEQYATETMKVTVRDTTVELTAEEMGITIDADEAVDAAYGSTGEFDISPYIKLNEEKLQAVVDEFGKKYNAELQETAYTIEGTAPSLTSAEPEEGTGQTLVVKLGSPKLGLDTEHLRKQILLGYSSGNFQITGDCTVIEPEMLDAEGLYEKFMTPAADAVLDPKTFAITPEVYGYSVDPQAAAEAVKDAGYGDTLRIPFAIIVPEVTYASIEAELYKDVLGECSTPYAGSDTNNRNTNLGLACEKLNGVVVLPGEVFSYNMTLGERTKENGWKPAASYVGGLTVDTYGGGICQGSTTLYNCVLQADFELVECYPHGYISSYVSPGLDASVNWGTADFRFKNTGNYPVKIIAHREKGKMTMQILGTDEKDYYVEMSYAVLGSTPYKVEYKDVDPNNNPQNYKDGQELVSPYTGYRVVTYKNRYSKATGEKLETKLERDFTYAFRNQVIVRLVDPNAPKPGTDPAPEGGTEGGADTGTEEENLTETP